MHLLQEVSACFGIVGGPDSLHSHSVSAIPGSPVHLCSIDDKFSQCLRRLDHLEPQTTKLGKTSDSFLNIEHQSGCTGYR